MTCLCSCVSYVVVLMGRGEDRRYILAYKSTRLIQGDPQFFSPARSVLDVDTGDTRLETHCAILEVKIISLERSERG